MSSAPDAHRIPNEEALGALMDGRSDAAGVQAACRAWRSDATARRRWHEWHLIGDALRSGELVAHAAHDAAFVARLRERLDREPVALAPAQQPHARRDVLKRRVWIGSAAVAAGFVAVAATLLVVQQPQGDGGAPQLVQAPAAAPRAVAVAAPAPVEPQTLVINGQLIRDARLDQYLAAHKQHSTMGMPAALMRPAPGDGARR
jgi:sigma-E factor negative regulatory protein RseA